MDVATHHDINPETGMIETSGNFMSPFDSDRKLQFLELYKQNGIRLRRACRSMGLSEATVSHHLKIDPVFKEQFDAVERDYIEELEAVSRENALNPKATIERIFQLKCLVPLKYGQENGYSQRSNGQIVINVNGDLLIDAKKRIESMARQIDQNVIDVSANLQNTVQPTQNNASIPSDNANSLNNNSLKSE